MHIFEMNKGRIVRRLLILSFLVMATISLECAAYGQTPSASPATSAVSGVIGEVKAIDATAKQMVVRDDKGVIFTVNFSDKTQYKRMAPGERTMAKATDITLADVGQGDRVWARWRAGSDQKTVPTAQVVVMSKADVAKKQEQERAEWRKRGVSGIVTSVNQIKINDLKTKKPITIVLKPDSVLRRWPENMTAMFGGGMGPGAGGPGRAGAGPGQPQNPGQAAQRPQGAGPGPGGPQGGGMRGGGMNVADILERLPTISINEVKVGD